MKGEENQLLKTESEQLSKLREIVRKTIEDEKLVIENLLNPPNEILTRGQKISDRVARFGGSWTFIIFFLILLFVWITYNYFSPVNKQFDPFPFILMNLILSCLAAFQAPIIMMSQNRQEEIDRKRSENDYMINLKAELEVRALNQKIDLLLEEQIKILFDTQVQQLSILKKIQEKLSIEDK